MNTTDRIKETLETLKIFSETADSVTRLPFNKRSKIGCKFFETKNGRSRT